MLTPRECANVIRLLSIDAVQKANSGHPGMPMGMADIAEVLWNGFLRHNPRNPKWLNRDRFVLSNGHGSMLLYAVLHLTGYDISIDDLKRFRQLHSKTPGHPEYAETPGVETTTGPLGQGLANAVGMAVAEKQLAAYFNRENLAIIDHYTYAFVGDGCLMEGISHEVGSFAGTFQLGKLIVFYDDNGISIDGEVPGWFCDDTPLRFEAYGWHVIRAVDGHDSTAIHRAIQAAQAETQRPTLICCKTQIGWGCDPLLAGTAKTHGQALGETGVAAVRKNLSWRHEPFVVLPEHYAAWNACEKGQANEDAWQALFMQYQQHYPELANELMRRFACCLPHAWTEHAQALLQVMEGKKESIATRKASQQCITHFAEILPELIGGSADLTESNLTDWPGVSAFQASYPLGRYIHYGVREFGMSAIINGLAIHGGFIPFGGTFLTFSDYARNAIRMAALMRAKTIFVYTHDSIGLGEDGPTHQPVEHIPSLRMIPNLSVWRPCDTLETAVAWQAAIEHAGPSCLLFSRQSLPYQLRDATAQAAIQRGGYILFEPEQTAKLIIIATGSEVVLAMAAAQYMQRVGCPIRVVSMPCTDVFLKQPLSYREDVLPPTLVLRLAIEAAASDYWYKFVGLQGRVLGLDRFGASAAVHDVFAECGFTVENVVSIINQMLPLSERPAENKFSQSVAREG